VGWHNVGRGDLRNYLLGVFRAARRRRHALLLCDDPRKRSLPDVRSADYSYLEAGLELPSAVVPNELVFRMWVGGSASLASRWPAGTIRLVGARLFAARQKNGVLTATT